MAIGPVPRRQRLEHDERRGQILACARKLFSERPYAAVSTTEIALEAGVARGLLNHYFGTKRELYLEVVRAVVRMPLNPVPSQSAQRGVELVISESVERWLEMLDRNRATWLAATGAQGLGRDPEVEAILDAAREQAVDRLVEAVYPHQGNHAPGELRAVIRSYAGFAESASFEWLVRGRLTREQVQVLLVRGFLNLVGDVLPAVERAGARTASTSD